MIFTKIRQKLQYVTASGKTRFVIAFPELGLVVKFPIVRLKYVCVKTKKDIKTHGFKVALSMWTMRSTNLFGHRYKIIEGVRANWRERKFWHKTQHRFLCPTLFSLFGLLNIQKYMKPLSIKNTDVGRPIARVTKGSSFGCGHEFESPPNFSCQDGHLVMLDYGSIEIQPVIIKFGEKLLCLTERDCVYRE
jgi:hypothetical protein